MKVTIQSCLLIMVSFALINQSVQGVQVSKPGDHDHWLAEVLKEIQTIEPGKTRREDLAKVLRISGGLSTPVRATFLYKDSLYIAVDIEFTPAVEGSRTESPKDIVKNISKPYLALPVLD